MHDHWANPVHSKAHPDFPEQIVYLFFTGGGIDAAQELASVIDDAELFVYPVTIT